MCIEYHSGKQLLQLRELSQANNGTWKLGRTKRLPSSMCGRICKATDRTNKIKLAKSVTEFMM